MLLRCFDALRRGIGQCFFDAPPRAQLGVFSCQRVARPRDLCGSSACDVRRAGSSMRHRRRFCETGIERVASMPYSAASSSAPSYGPLSRVVAPASFPPRRVLRRVSSAVPLPLLSLRPCAASSAVAPAGGSALSLSFRASCSVVLASSSVGARAPRRFVSCRLALSVPELFADRFVRVSLVFYAQALLVAVAVRACLHLLFSLYIVRCVSY